MITITIPRAVLRTILSCAAFTLRKTVQLPDASQDEKQTLAAIRKLQLEHNLT